MSQYTYTRKEGNPYRLPLGLTKEMKMALDRLVVRERVADDFPVALKVFRAGLIVYDALETEELKAMLERRKMTQEEAKFLIEKGLVKDFRSMTPEARKQVDSDARIDFQLKMFAQAWKDLKDDSKKRALDLAEQYPELPNAKVVINLSERGGS